MLLALTSLLYLTSISVFDISSSRIPNFLNLFFLFCFIHLDFIFSKSRIPSALLSALFFSGVFLLGFFITKGIGAGDIKMAFVAGYMAGFFKGAVSFIIACILGIFVILIFRLCGKKIRKIPFAPFVEAGFIFSEFCCRRIL